MQELEQQLASPISKAASQVGHPDLQAVVAKLTCQEGCALLYESAKEHVGAKKVHAICEAMVRLYFFRSKSFRNGKDWLDGIGRQKFRNLTFLVTVDWAELQCNQEFGAIKPDCNMDVALRVAAGIAELAETDTADLHTLMKTYLDLFSWEMKQRGFLLITSTCRCPKAWVRRTVPAWKLQRDVV